jgi:hypothetical protein
MKFQKRIIGLIKKLGKGKALLGSYRVNTRLNQLL